VDPQQPSTVFAGMYGGGISKTTDHGGSWQAINVNLPSVSVIAIDPVDSNIIYAGTANFCGCQAAPPYAGFWKSLDGGATWQRSDSGLPSRVGGIFSIAIDPRNHRKIYLATDDDVYVSRDGAGHWSRVGAGLQVGIGIPPLIISQRHADTLLAGNRGVFEFALREPRLVNFSTLGRVGSGPDVLTAGFVVDGASAMPMVLRAIGPTLAEVPFNLNGPLPDPELTVFGPGPTATIVAQNDNWKDSDAAAFARANAFPLPADSRDAGLALALAPGAYTAR
jgi:hypothetical protein